MSALAACARAANNTEPNPQIHDAYDGLITDFERLAPRLLPKDACYILWHPDLHASNIIVNDKTGAFKLQGIIDWQGAHTLPTYMQIKVPPAYTTEPHPLVACSSEDGPMLTPQAETLDETQQRSAQAALRRAWRQYLHEAIIRDEDKYLAPEMYEEAGVVKGALSMPMQTITRGATEGVALCKIQISSQVSK